MKRTIYIIYYTDKDGTSEGFEAYGSEDMKAELRWLHSPEIKASRIEIYKRGKDFDQNHDDVTEAWRKSWK